jgi:hypothetical protein
MSKRSLLEKEARKIKECAECKKGKSGKAVPGEGNPEGEKNVESKFKVGDRVKTWYHDKWWSGTVVRFRPRPIKVPCPLFETFKKMMDLTIIREDERDVTYEHPTRISMEIKTDEKVGDDSDLLHSFGLIGSPKGPFTILENEPVPDTNDPDFWNR